MRTPTDERGLIADLLLYDAIVARGETPRRRPLRGIGDEFLHHLRTFWWRRDAGLGDQLRALMDADMDLAVRAALTLPRAIAAIRRALDAEEEYRERQRARGVPRQAPAGWMPDEIKEEIRRRVRLDDLYERTTGRRLGPLRQGRRSGQCPFGHRKPDPHTLTLFLDDPADQHFHCYDCKAHGDSFDFLKRTLGLTFGEARDTLADMAGVAWPPAPPGPPTPRGGQSVPDYLALVREPA